MAAAVFSRYGRNLTQSSRASRRGPRFRLDLASRRGHCRILWRHAQQERARRGRHNDSHRARENSHERPNLVRSSHTPKYARPRRTAPEPPPFLAAGIGSFLVAVFRHPRRQIAVHQEPDELLQAHRTALRRHHLRDPRVARRVGTLHWRWNVGGVSAIARITAGGIRSALACPVLLTFPPIADLF